MFEKIIRYWDTTTFYVNRIVFYGGLAAAVLFMLSYFFPVLFTIAILILLFTSLSVLAEAILLYRKSNGIDAVRILPDRMSNSDENKVVLQLQNGYEFKITCTIIDELPFQFQDRKWEHTIEMDAFKDTEFEYSLKPKERGDYEFGNINLYVQGPLRLIRRRFIFNQGQTVKVYPSYVQMRRFQLIAVANRLQQTGVKRMRKL